MKLCISDNHYPTALNNSITYRAGLKIFDLLITSSMTYFAKLSKVYRGPARQKIMNQNRLSRS